MAITLPIIGQPDWGEPLNRALQELDSRVGAPGPKGDKGEKGDTGLPGPAAVENDQAVAAYIQSDSAKSSLAVAAATAAHTDYVSILSGMACYTSMTVAKENAAGAVRVTCRASNGKSVSHLFTPTGRYQYAGAVDTLEYVASDVLKVPFGGLDVTGDWLGTGSSPYTLLVGASFQVRVETVDAGAVVQFRSYTDNRGGVWKIFLVEDPSTVSTVSTWSELGAPRKREVLTIATPGTWTIRGEFQGQDPEHPVSAPRGWLGSVDGSQGTETLEVSGVKSGGAPVWKRVAPVSNKDFAFSYRKRGEGQFEFTPFHGTESEAPAAPTRYYLDGKLIDVQALPVGEAVSAAESVEIVQSIYGRNSTSANPAENLTQVWTSQRITANGELKIVGRWKALRELDASASIYVMMLAGVMPEFDEVVSSMGTSYRVYPTMAPAYINQVAEQDRPTGYALLSSTTGLVAAVRYDNQRETMRMGKPDKAADPATRIFIELRAGGGMIKVYPRLYGQGAVIPEGTIQRFSGTYFYGDVPSARNVLSLA